MEIMNEEDISAANARFILHERKKSGELVYEQKICMEFLDKVSKLTEKQLQDMIEELSKIAILKPRYIALIINIMPDTEEEVETLFSKERINLKREEIKQIVDIVSKFKK